MTVPAPSPAQRLVEGWAAIRHHLALCLVTAAVLFVAAAAWILHLPNVYQATTRILVNPQRISDKYVSSTVSMDTTERLNTLSQQVLSSTRLGAIVQQLNLYPELRRKYGRDRVLDTMRHHIAIELKQSADGPSAFTISYTGNSARQVAAVTGRLAASFISWNLHDREQETEGATLFLDSELQQTKAQLDQLEEKLREYKLEHLGELPDQLQANMQTLGRLQVQLQANVDSQARLDQDALLAGADPGAPLPDIGGAAAPGRTPREQLAARDAQAHRDLAALRRRYTDEFPDVVSKQQEVANLDAALAGLPQLSADDADQRSAARTDPRLAVISHDRARLAAGRRSIEAQINLYQARINQEPIREQEIAQLLRDYDTAKAHYSSLLEKTYSANMADELERRRQGASFTMLDPARVPDAPIGPNRPALLLGAFCFSLAAGVAAATLRDLMSHSIKSEAELREAVPGVPVLGFTPRLQVAHSGAARLAGGRQ